MGFGVTARSLLQDGVTALFFITFTALISNINVCKWYKYTGDPSQMGWQKNEAKAISTPKLTHYKQIRNFLFLLMA